MLDRVCDRLLPTRGLYVCTVYAGALSTRIRFFAVHAILGFYVRPAVRQREQTGAKLGMGGRMRMGVRRGIHTTYAEGPQLDRVCVRERGVRPLDGMVVNHR